jgi:hypothetical protein
VAFSDVKISGPGQRANGLSVIAGNNPYNLMSGENLPDDKSNRVKIKNKQNAQDGRGLGKAIIKQDNLKSMIDKMKLSLSKKTKSLHDKFATKGKIGADGNIGNTTAHNVSPHNNTLNDIVLCGLKENSKSNKSSLNGFAQNNSLIIQKLKTNSTNSSSNTAIFDRGSAKAPNPSPTQKFPDPTTPDLFLLQNPSLWKLTPIRSISKTIEVNINDSSGRGNFPTKIKLDP